MLRWAGLLLLTPALPGQGLWESRAPTPIAATEVASAYLNGSIYTVCGLTRTGWATEMSIYDVRRDEWRRGPLLPIAGGADHCNFAAAGGELCSSRVRFGSGLRLWTATPMNTIRGQIPGRQLDV